MSAILKCDFQKRKQLHFFQKKTTQKDPILNVTITFSLKQGQTGRSSILICVPLKVYHRFCVPFKFQVETW